MIRKINDPRDLNGSALQQAMVNAGRDPKLRSELIDIFINAEKYLDYSGNVREDITGPIIDALHDGSEIYNKELSNGTCFRFYYRSKIARDFLMSPNINPNHVWEPQTTRLMLRLSAESKKDVLIGGAYFGDHAILVAKHINSRGGQVHCFEPNIDQASMLVENIKLNQISNLEISRKGLWSKSKSKLKLDGFDSFANAIPASEKEDGFETITIDGYCSGEDIRLGLIQLDIEGGEIAALKGAQITLAEDGPDIIFEIHQHYVDWSDGLENTEVVCFLISLGYKVYAIRDFNSHYDMKNKPIELIPACEVYLEGPPHGFNMLAVRDPLKLQVPFYSIVKEVSPKLLTHKNPKLHHPLDGL